MEYIYIYIVNYIVIEYRLVTFVTSFFSLQHAKVNVGKLHISCDIHKAHAIAGAMFSLCPDSATGMIRTALAIRSGWMSRLRACLKRLIRRKLRIYHYTQPPESSHEYRDFMISTFFSACNSAELAALRFLLNGDWQHSEEIQHFCSGPGCCPSEAHTAQQIETWMIRIFARQAPHIFPRHKWIGAHIAVDFFGRLQAVNCLFTHVIAELFGPEFQSQQKDPSHAGLDPEEVSILAKLQSLETLGSNVQGISQAEAGMEDDDFKKVSKGWRQTSFQWSKSPRLLADLLFCRLALKPQVELMARQLKVSAKDWDQQEILREARTGLRQYRMSWSFENSAPQALMKDICSLLCFDFTNVLRSSNLLTEADSAILFRFLMRVAAATHHYLLRRHLQYPWKLFSALLPGNKDAAETSINFDLKNQRCCMDTFSNWFLEPYISEGKVQLSTVALSELHSIACQALVDIGGVECNHAANRRLIESKSLHTHSTNLSLTSAYFAARCFRTSTFLGFDSTVGERRNKQKTGPKTGKKKNRNLKELDASQNSKQKVGD